MTQLPEISIIGPGKVGTVLGVLAARAGYRVTAVAGRTAESATEAAAAIGPGTIATDMQSAARGELVLLTVPDEAIEPLCNRLGEERAFVAGSVVAHCSGALSSEVLHAAREQGCHVGSLHPLQTFPSVRAGLERMQGTFFFCEGDAPATSVLEQLAAAVGGRPFQIAPAAKPLYHAMACMASNYMVALMDAALSAGERAGIPRKFATEALYPLVAATLENIHEVGPAKALTGPIVRGDAQTVQRHLDALVGVPQLADLYRTMGKWTLDVARQKGTLAPVALSEIRRLLEKPSQPHKEK